MDDLLKDDTTKSEAKRDQSKSTFTDVVLPIGTRDTNLDEMLEGTEILWSEYLSFFKELQNDPRSTDVSKAQFYENA